MKRNKQIPDYDISESINIIENPELELIIKGRDDIISIFKDDLSELELQKIKERRLI